MTLEQALKSATERNFAVSFVPKGEQILVRTVVWETGTAGKVAEGRVMTWAEVPVMIEAHTASLEAYRKVRKLRP